MRPTGRPRSALFAIGWCHQKAISPIPWARRAVTAPGGSPPVGGVCRGVTRSFLSEPQGTSRWAHCAGDVRPGIVASGSWPTMLLAAKDSERNV